MFDLTTTDHFRAILAASKQIGAELPAGLLEAWQRANRLTQAAEALYPPKGALVSAVIKALDAGRDPAADKTVQRTLTAQQLGASNGPVFNGLQAALDGDLQHALTTNAAAILDTWAKPFTAAAATLHAAHNQLGDVDLDDTGAVVRQGGDAAAVWAQARAATTVIEQIDAGWARLAMATRFAPHDARHSALRITAPTLQQWQEIEELHRPKVSAWTVVRAGLSLSLADGPEYARRVAAVQPPAPVKAKDPSRKADTRVLRSLA